MPLNILSRSIPALLVALFITACGGGGGSGGGTTTPATTTITGRFVDATVVGISYKCGTSTTVSGTTNANGEFTCPTGQAVAFYVGDILVGSVPTATSLVTPLDLVGVGATPTNTTVANIVRFLMSISSSDPATGTITITPAVIAAAAGKTVDFTAVSGTAMDTLIPTLKSGATIYTAAQATAHVTSSINGLFAGNYAGTYSGAMSGTWSVTIAANGAVTGTADGSSAITGTMATTLSTGSTYGFTGTAGGTPWVGTLNISTKVFSGTWNDGAGSSGTWTGTTSAGGGTGTTVAPSSPTSVAATPVSASVINVTWGAVSGATGYNVYRSTTSPVAISTANKITASPVVDTGLGDSGLTASTQYFYKVTAVNAAGESAASAEATATTSAVGVGTPIITGFTPTSGGAGTVVTITGTNIDLINGGTTNVYFKNLLVIPASVTSSSITATVPANLFPKPASLTPSQHTIAVTGVNGGVAMPAGIFTLTTTAVLPAIPSGVTATALSASQVNLSWTAVPGAAAYYVYRSTATGVTIAVGNYVAGSVTTTANLTTGHLPSTAYYYTVTAVNEAGESAGSSEVTATTPAAVPPSAPTLITATPISATQINLSWPAVAGATAYRVYRNTTLGFTVVKENAQGYGDFIGQTSATTFNDVGSVIARALFPSNTPYYSTVTNYYYKVTAVNAFGESVVSPEVGAITNNGAALGVGITVAPAFKNLLAFAGAAPTTSSVTPAAGVAQFNYLQTSPNSAKDFLDITHLVGATATTVSIQMNVGTPIAAACVSCEKGTMFWSAKLACTITGASTANFPLCSGVGVVFDQAVGSVTFTNATFTSLGAVSTHTVNGTLSFTPF